jgi:hypothetical protein
MPTMRDPVNPMSGGKGVRDPGRGVNNAPKDGTGGVDHTDLGRRPVSTMSVGRPEKDPQKGGGGKGKK